MRARFNKSIYLCTKVTHSYDSGLLLFTTSNGVYVVNIEDVDKAQELFLKMLTDGYCDVSDYEYSN